MHLADEMLDHFLGAVEIGNHPVAHRADRLDRARRAAQHELGILAHRQNLLFAVLDVIGHDRGFIQHDALAAHVDQRIGRAEVDTHVRRK